MALGKVRTLKKEEKDLERIENIEDYRDSLVYKTARKFYVERIFSEMGQDELAEKIGTKKSSISRFESGRQNVSLNYIEQLAKAMKKDVNVVLSDVKVDYYGNNTDYVLKIYDEDLIKFSLFRDGLISCKINWINEDKKHLFPLDLELSNDGIIKWIDKRSIPKNRAFVSEILDSIGVARDDIKGIIDLCMGLSLNDSYWIVPQGSERKFSDFNLYENRFTEALSIIAYTGWKYDSIDFYSSPEISTNGTLRKGWRIDSKGNRWLYKGGTDGFANTGLEPYSEFLASQVAEKMQLKSVKYEIENWKGILSSKCKLFTDIDTSYVPIGRIVRTGGIDAVIKYYKELGEDFYQDLASMLVFDAVILNEDRHFGNFGLLRDNKTGKILETAPIFDNGISLLCYAMNIDFEKSITDYINTRTNPYEFYNQFIPLAKKVMGHRQKEELRRLINFKFTENNVANLPTWRIEALEKIIQDRVKLLLE